MDYPKLLIVGVEDVFETNNSSALTARSFLEDWPKDKLRQIVCGEAETSPSTYVLKRSDKWFSMFFARKKVKPASIGKNDARAYNKDVSLKHKIHQWLVYLYSILPYSYRPELRQFIDDFNPDVIYSYHGGGYCVLCLCTKISRKKKIPFIPHFLDDWPSFICEESSLFRRLSLSLVRRIIKKAPSVLCISEAMCQEYEVRYKCRKFISLMHSVLPSFNSQYVDNSRKKLIYAGSLYFGRQNTLVKFCDIIKNNRDWNVELIIYTTPNGWEELKGCFTPYPFVSYGGFVSQEELTVQISSSFGLLFLESFDKEPLKYTRLSLSTKVPEYLASGRPILAIGNETQGSISYLKNNCAAYCITNIDEMDCVVNDFIGLRNWEDISNNAKTLFLTNHEKEQQKKRFLELVSNCVNKK